MGRWRGKKRSFRAESAILVKIGQASAAGTSRLGGFFRQRPIAQNAALAFAAKLRFGSGQVL